MKPMNCPHHTQIYAHKKRSYRELPQRYAETTMVYRDEQSGELSGLSRVRAITQDDAHVFCRESQVKDEFNKIWDIIDEFYSTMGIKLRMRLSFHDPENFDAYLGDAEVWAKSEGMLRELAEERGFDYFEQQGEAAMYGPKTDFMGMDSLGREHQVATVQLDMNMPARFGLTCVNEKGDEEQIVMIHAAIMGSIERFSSVMIEHFAGAFPTWLAPEQLRILPISEEQEKAAEDLADYLRERAAEDRIELRLSVDKRSDRLQARIRDAANMKVPYTLVIGAREVENKQVAVRRFGSGNQGAVSQKEFADSLISEITERKLAVTTI